MQKMNDQNLERNHLQSQESDNLLLENDYITSPDVPEFAKSINYQTSENIDLTLSTINWKSFLKFTLVSCMLNVVNKYCH